MDDEDVAAAARALRDADTAVAFTGAGVSVPSGIPPFRGEGGIWDDYDPDAFDLRRFQARPGEFWADWLDLRADLYDESAAPNPAHEALADLAAAGRLDAVVTQNIDGLHREAAANAGSGGECEDAGTEGDNAGSGSEDAGSTPVVELHGNARRAVCRDCGREVAADDARRRAEAGELPPRCGSCDSVLKPDAVLFGERLPAEALARAEQYAEDADAFLVAGSSLTVEPAASLPRRAARTGATLLVVDLDGTPLDSRADHVFCADVTEVLPALRDAVVD